ncbi:MAG: nucleoside deaminase [Rickettsiaceae bacterium]|jgi:tRNA(Arg) A34 adenosine deaminase TadA|nr:nucleoside deaminase [Rickettsiaceae bacterium]
MTNQFIKKALEQAQIAFEKGEVPVGAVVVKDNQIIAKSYNQNIALQDSTAHAEILAIRKANQILQSHRLDGCDLYVSLEPCAMCAAAISLARINRLYYAASDVKSGGVENGARVFSHPQCHHRPEIYGGINAGESEQLLKKFFEQKRKIEN